VTRLVPTTTIVAPMVMCAYQLQVNITLQEPVLSVLQAATIQAQRMLIHGFIPITTSTTQRQQIIHAVLVLVEDIQVPEQQAAPLVTMANILVLLLPRVRIVVQGNILTHMKLPQKDFAQIVVLALTMVIPAKPSVQGHLQDTT
jgi:hypothetical protein